MTAATTAKPPPAPEESDMTKRGRFAGLMSGPAVQLRLHQVKLVSADGKAVLFPDTKGAPPYIVFAGLVGVRRQ